MDCACLEEIVMWFSVFWNVHGCILIVCCTMMHLRCYGSVLTLLQFSYVVLFFGCGSGNMMNLFDFCLT